MAIFDELNVKDLDGFKNVDGSVVVPCNGVFDTDKIKLRTESNENIRKKINNLYKENNTSEVGTKKKTNLDDIEFTSIIENNIKNIDVKPLNVPSYMFNAIIKSVNTKTSSIPITNKVENTSVVEIKQEPVKMGNDSIQDKIIDFVEKRDTYMPKVVPLRTKEEPSFDPISSITNLTNKEEQPVNNTFEIRFDDEDKKIEPVLSDETIDFTKVSKYPLKKANISFTEEEKPIEKNAVEEYNDIFSSVKFEMPTTVEITQEEVDKTISKMKPVSITKNINEVSDLEKLRMEFENTREAQRKIEEEKINISKAVEETASELQKIKEEEQQKIVEFNQKIEAKTRQIDEEKQRVEELRKQQQRVQEEISKAKERNAELDQLLKVV